MTANNDGVFDLGRSLDIIRRRKWGFLTVFSVVVAAGVAIALALPPTYKSQSKVLIERQQIPDDLVASTVTGYVQERIQLIAQRILTPEELMRIARKVGVPEGNLDESSPNYLKEREDFVEQMITSTAVEMVDVQVETPRNGRSTSLITIAFTVSFEHSDPDVAMKMANELTDLIMTENAVQRTEQAVLTADFLDEAGARVQREIAMLEDELSTLVADKYEFLPDQLEDTREMLALNRTEQIRLNGEISFLENRVSQLSDQLARTSRHAIAGNANLSNVEDARVRLAKARLDLKNALETYTANHPDVRRLEQLIVDLEREARGQSRSRQDLSVPTNPAYLKAEEQLREMEARLNAARSSKAQIEGVIAELQSKSVRDPSVERKYNALMRDLDRAQKEYAEVKDRAYAARMAQSMESEQRGERFVLLLPASRPRLPESPNRIGIMLLAVLFGGFAGAARVVWRESTDSTIRDASDVQKVFGAQPIGVIPSITSAGV